MQQSVGWIALVSGLTGALITAIFNYIVNVKIANRNRRIEQQKLAFLYLVRLSNILALELVIKYISSAFEGTIQKVVSILEIEKTEIEMSNTAFVVITEGIKKLVKDGGKEYESFKMFINYFKTLSTDLFGYELPDQLLSQFPKVAVIEYDFLVGRLKDIRASFYNLSISFEDKKPELIEPQSISLLWNSARKIPQLAKNFRDYLVIETKLDKKFASEITNRQAKELYEGIRIGILQKEQLEQASKWLQEKIQPQTDPSDD